MLRLSVPIALRQRRTGFYLLLGLLAVVLAFGAYRYWHKAPRYKGVSRLQVDLRQPEMLLVTRNLSALPKDIAAAPLLAGLVDEQLVFHYEEDEARLSIEGSLRRLAYEHQLGIEDRFLSTLLAGPAEIGLWRSGKGRPEHIVARLERGVLARLTEALARIALDDRQLKQAGKFSVGGDEVTLYTLDYGGGRTLAFAGRGDHWVFLSDPALALDIEGRLTGDAEVVLGDLLRGGQPWQAKLPSSTTAQHSFVVGQRALSMGYQHFLPTLAGLRLDQEGGRWQARLRLQPTKPQVTQDMATIWRAVPLGAACCIALPVDWQAAAAPLATLLGKQPGDPAHSRRAGPDRRRLLVCQFPPFGAAVHRPCGSGDVARCRPVACPIGGKVLVRQRCSSRGHRRRGADPCRHRGVASRHPPARRWCACLRAGAGLARGADSLFSRSSPGRRGARRRRQARRGSRRRGRPAWPGWLVFDPPSLARG
jgi:hypothetical protein